MSSGPKIITLDIETSPIIAYTWGLWKQNIGLNQIIRDWSVLSFCAKTLGKRKVRYMDVADQEDFYDDRAIMAALAKELDEADIVITQNGISFDIKKINARLLQLGIKPPSPFKQIDTKVEAVKIARFTSNKLEWLGAILTDAPKDKHKEFPGMELWTECLKGNPRAWAVMRKYNPQDVITTEKTYLRMRPYIIGHPNLPIYDDADTMRCPRCNSEDVHPRGFSYTQVGKYQRYHCGECGGWSRGRKTLNSRAKRDTLLTN